MRSFSAQASSPPANRFTCVGVSGSSLSLKEREAEARKGAIGNSRGVFPGSPGNRGTRQRLSALRRGDFFDLWDLTSGHRRELFSPSRQVTPPFAGTRPAT